LTSIEDLRKIKESDSKNNSVEDLKLVNHDKDEINETNYHNNHN